jgi:hypothetical protein
MLYPARLGVDLFVFHLVNADHTTIMIEQHATGAGGALINCSYVLSHFVFSPS